MRHFLSLTIKCQNKVGFFSAKIRFICQKIDDTYYAKIRFTFEDVDNILKNAEIRFIGPKNAYKKLKLILAFYCTTLV